MHGKTGNKNFAAFQFPGPVLSAEAWDTQESLDQTGVGLRTYPLQAVMSAAVYCTRVPEKCGTNFPIEPQPL